jgi:cell division protein FtsQ
MTTRTTTNRTTNRTGNRATTGATNRTATRTVGRATGGTVGRATGGTVGRATGGSPGRASRQRTAPRPPTPRRAQGTVSPTSAQRFAQKACRRRRQRVMVLAAALVFGLGVGWVLFGSQFLAVQRVEVVGLHRVGLADVQQAAAGQLGRPMALTSPQAVAERVVRLPLVLSARVERSWPSTLLIIVVERQPIAAVPLSAGGFALMDGDGVTVATAGSPPPGLPVLDVDVRRAGPAALQAARQVSDSLPDTLRTGLRQISAVSPDAVSIVLADGSTVLWGSAKDSSDKILALHAVHPKALPHPMLIDVSAPEAPAVTGRP